MITTDVPTVVTLVLCNAAIVFVMLFYFIGRIKRLKNQESINDELSATNLQLINQVHSYQNFLSSADILEVEVNNKKYWFKPIEVGPYFILKLHDQIKPRPAAASVSLVQGINGFIIEGFRADDIEVGKFIVAKLMRLKSGNKVALSEVIPQETFDLFMKCNGRLVVGDTANTWKAVHPVGWLSPKERGQDKDN